MLLNLFYRSQTKSVEAVESLPALPKIGRVSTVQSQVLPGLDRLLVATQAEGKKHPASMSQKSQKADGEKRGQVTLHSTAAVSTPAEAGTAASTCMRGLHVIFCMWKKNNLTISPILHLQKVATPSHDAAEVVSLISKSFWKHILVCFLSYCVVCEIELRLRTGFGAVCICS